MTQFFLQIFIYLAAAVITVPLSKKLGLGSVLGYLVAGIIIGPMLGLVGAETTTIQHYAKFAIVMMLFLIGLELEPHHLWSLRRDLVGLGGSQLVVTTIAIMAILIAFSITWQTAFIIGAVLAISSTAIVIQTFRERGLTTTPGGEGAFAVVLFQDIMVIPILAIIPLLGLPSLMASADAIANIAQNSELSYIKAMPNWLYTLLICAAISFICVGGHYFSRPLFKYVAASKLREIFTATALMLVIGIAALMQLIGLPPALGAFLGGVMLANSEFRHEIQASIEPIKGLMLGLFFITIGAGIELKLLTEHLFLVLGLTFGLMFLKAIVVMLVAIIFKIKHTNRWLLIFGLSQAGGFSFVLLGFAHQSFVISTQLTQLLTLIITLTIFFTPINFIIYDKFIEPRYKKKNNAPTANTKILEQAPIIIAGAGRFGQIVNRLLITNGMKTTVLDHDAAIVETLRLLKTKTYYGDASQPDLLLTAGIEHAKLIIIAIDNIELRKEMILYIKKNYPQVKILSRAYDRGDSYQLQMEGADYTCSETFHSALDLGAKALEFSGQHPFLVEQQKAAFNHVEKLGSEQLYQAWLKEHAGEDFADNYRELFIQLETNIAGAMDKINNSHRNICERAWNPPPPHYDDYCQKR